MPAQVHPAGRLAASISSARAVTAWVAAEGLRDANEAGAAASEYLRLFAQVALGYLWARTAKVALDAGNGKDFYRAKLNTARFYLRRMLPQTRALAACITAGAASIQGFEDEDF